MDELEEDVVPPDVEVLPDGDGPPVDVDAGAVVVEDLADAVSLEVWVVDSVLTVFDVLLKVVFEIDVACLG